MATKKDKFVLVNEIVEDAPPLTKSEPESLVKSILNVLNGPKGSIERLAFETDPSQNNTYAALYKYKQRLIPDTILKRIAIQDDLVASIVHARSNHMSAFGRPRPDRFSTGFVIEPNVGVVDKLNDDEKADLDKRLERSIKILNTCGNTSGWSDDDKMSFSQWLAMSARNAIVVGRLATEIVWVTGDDGQRKFHSFRPIDAGTIYRAAPQKHAADNVRKQAMALLESIKNKKLKPENFSNDSYSWVQVVESRPVQAFTAEECVVHNFYPVPDVELDGYPVTPIDTMIAAVTTHINITTHNKMYFQTGRAAKGMLVIKSDDISEGVVARIKHQFNACVDGSALVITKELGETSVNTLLDGADSKMVTIWTGRDWQSASVYKTGKKTLVHTKLANGVIAPTSPDHRFLAVGKFGPVWKEQKDLQIGDYLCVNNKEVSDSDYVPRFGDRAATPEIMEVLGWLIGDGNLAIKGDHERNVDSFRLYYHHDKEPEILDRHLAILTGFGVNAVKYKRVIGEAEAESIKDRYGFKNVAPCRIGIDSYDSSFVRWLISMGFSSSKNGKRIPPQFYKLPTKLKAAFLRGFFSADGSNSGRKDPVIHITSNSLRAQTRSLLLSLGIRTAPAEGVSGGRFGTDRKLCSIKVKDRKKFFELVGFVQPHKQPKADFETSTHGRSDRLPPETVQELARQIRKFDDEHDTLDIKARQKINDVICGTTPSTRKRLLDLMQMAKFVPPQWMLDYNFEPVVEKEDTGLSVEMFDATVYDEQHTFLVNGVVTHNSINSVNNAHRTPIFGIGSTDELTWSSIDGGNRDMEFQYLTDMNARVILSAFQMSPEELPGWSYLSRGTNSQALSESNGEYKMEAARDLGIRPLIAQFEDFINTTIFPLIDKSLSAICRVRLIGLDSETAEKESVRLQQDMPVHMAYDEVLKKVEKSPVGKELGGMFPLNPQYQAVLDKYITVGTVLEQFFGIKDASRDPKLAYIRDPMWFQWQQMQMQAQQMQAQAAQQQQGQQQGQQPGQGGQAQAQEQQPGGSAPAQAGSDQPGPPDRNPYSAQTEKQKSADSSDATGSAGQDLTRSIDQALDLLTKSEEQLPPSRRRLLSRHKQVVQRFLEGWEKDLSDATKEILDIADQHVPSNKK